MPRQTSGSSTSHEAGGPRWSWSLPAGTFLAGLVLGGVVVGVGAVPSDDEPNAPTVAAADETDGTDGTDGTDEADSPAGSDPEDTDGTGSSVHVPDSCLQTADGATTLVEHVDRVVAAVADLEPERLRQTVDDVQQVRDEVQGVAEQCRAAAEPGLQDEADAQADTAPAPTPAS